MPGEEAIIKLTNYHKKYYEGEIVSLKKTSPFRLTPRCPYLNCGCALKHLTYKEQLKYKEQKVREIFKKFAHFSPEFKPIVPCSNPLYYRNKVTLKVADYVGYVQNHSHQIIPIDKCALAHPKINEVIKRLNTLDLTRPKEIVIKDFEQTMVIIKGFLDIMPLKDLVDTIYLDEKLVYGKPFVKTKLSDLTFRISKDSFFQVNTEMAEKLYDIALKYCGTDKSQKVLDLYCGTGTLTLLLSNHFKTVTGIEINQEAIKCALENQKINQIKNVNFICADVSSAITKLQADIIVVDPPRRGLTTKGITDILQIRPQKIVYISCDPITLARDLHVLKEYYQIAEVTLVDMFPNTYSVESVVKLTIK